MVLAVRIQKQKSKGKEILGRKEKIKNKIKKRIIILTMKRYPRNRQKGDPEFSTE